MRLLQAPQYLLGLEMNVWYYHEHQLSVCRHDQTSSFCDPEWGGFKLNSVNHFKTTIKETFLVQKTQRYFTMDITLCQSQEQFLVTNG